MNTIELTRDPDTGLKGLHLKGSIRYHSNFDEIIIAHGVKLAPLVDGQSSIPFVDGVNAELTPFSFPLVVDAADPADQQGLAHYNRILAHIGTHTTHASHEDLPPLEQTQVEQDINRAFISIGNIFPRLVKLEKAFVPPIIFDKWVVQGQELRLNRGGSTGDDCIIGITNGFGGLCPSRIEGQPEESQERILTIEVNGSTHLLHIFSRGDTGRIADAIASNSQVPTLGTSRPESGGESG